MEDSLRESKQLVLQSAKMAALGEMAGAIAHEINTPLNTISFRAFQLIQISEEKQVDDLKKIGEEIESIVFRIAEIVKGLRTIARDGSKDEMKEIGVKGLISSTLSFCRERMASSGVAIEVAPIEDTLVVRGREVELSQVLLNLLNNSFDAVIPLAEKWIHIAIREIDHKVIIIVADSGRGIPAPIREKIMQPFFTTKEIGQGMGIGLSVSKGIMESHHGALHLVDTAPHTTFEMRLPRA
jgi:C4-dicarboxylate-specific signal transduction histidine kinase